MKVKMNSASPVITFQWAAHSHNGSRKARNDDALIAFASGAKGAEILPARGSHPLLASDLVFAIADGMGGGNAGDLAAKLLLHKLSERIPETLKAAASGFFPDSLAHLNEAVRSVHEQINATASLREEHAGMAATLALAWFSLENLYLANVGDTRIYRSRKGVLNQLSCDHTIAWSEWKRGTISEIQYRTHPRRCALYEVVGGGGNGLNPHLAAFLYEAGDRFLVCSDGLIDGVWERHIAEALASSDPPQGILDRLLKRAIDNSGFDDTTLIVIAAGTSK